MSLSNLPILKLIPADFLTRIVDRLPFLTENSIYRRINARAAFFALGAIVASIKAFAFARGLLAPLFRFDRDLLGRYGANSWAVITGASSGIGEAFAYELARRGFNIALVGRNEEKLAKVMREINKIAPSVQTKIIVADFAKSYEEGFAESIHNQMKGLDVSLLINNAGVFDKSYFYEVPVPKVNELVLTNILSHALITRVFLPDLAARTEKSGIINVTSMAMSCPRPFVTLYSATKACHDYVSRSLAYEHPNVDFLSLRPGYVSTNMTGYRELDYRTITAEECAKAGLNNLGRVNYTYGPWKHRLDGFIVENVPEFLKMSFFRKRYNMK